MMCAIIRAVVVLPLVPGDGDDRHPRRRPGREEEVDDGLGDVLRLADRRVRVHPEPRRGVDLADRAARLTDGRGDVRADEVDAGDVEPDEAGRLLGDLDVVGVGVEGAVDGDASGRHVAGQRELDDGVGGRHVVEAQALLREQLDRGGVDLDLRQHLLVADAPSRVGVGQLDELGHRVDAVARHVRRHALGDRLHPPADDEAAVVAAGDERLDEDVPPPGLLLGDGERGPHVGIGLQVEADPAPVVAVERLDDDGEADPPGRGDGARRPTGPSPGGAPGAPRTRAA